MRFWLGKRDINLPEIYEISKIKKGWDKIGGWAIRMDSRKSPIVVHTSFIEKLIGTSLKPGEVREIEIEIRLK